MLYARRKSTGSQVLDSYNDSDACFRDIRASKLEVGRYRNTFVHRNSIDMLFKQAVIGPYGPHEARWGSLIVGLTIG